MVICSNMWCVIIVLLWLIASPSHTATVPHGGLSRVLIIDVFSSPHDEFDDDGQVNTGDRQASSAVLGSGNVSDDDPINASADVIVPTPPKYIVDDDLEKDSGSAILILSPSYTLLNGKRNTSDSVILILSPSENVSDNVINSTGSGKKVSDSGDTKVNIINGRNVKNGENESRSIDKTSDVTGLSQKLELLHLALKGASGGSRNTWITKAFDYFRKEAGNRYRASLIKAVFGKKGNPYDMIRRQNITYDLLNKVEKGENKTGETDSIIKPNGMKNNVGNKQEDDDIDYSSGKVHIVYLLFFLSLILSFSFL